MYSYMLANKAEVHDRVVRVVCRFRRRMEERAKEKEEKLKEKEQRKKDRLGQLKDEATKELVLPLVRVYLYNSLRRCIHVAM